MEYPENYTDHVEGRELLYLTTDYVPEKHKNKLTVGKNYYPLYGSRHFTTIVTDDGYYWTISFSFNCWSLGYEKNWKPHYKDE